MADELIPGRGKSALSGLPGGPKLASAPVREPVRRRLSDAELLAQYDEPEDSKFAIPHGIVPDGTVYEWKAETVMGKPNITGMSRYQQRGWQFVPTDRHPGIWTQPGATGAIRLEGMVLMEIDSYHYENLRRLDGVKARGAVNDLCAQLGSAPPGTGPRSAHPKTMPSVQRSYEPLPVE